MKSTDIERRDREIRKSRKKEELIEKRLSHRDNQSIGEYINRLSSLFFHDDKRIYNLDNGEIKSLVEEIKSVMPEKQWETIIRKAIRKTKVEQREEAYDVLKKYL